MNEIILENVFVYGKKVNDLLTVDYDALTTLNISATQQLNNEIEALKAVNKKLEERLLAIENLLNKTQTINSLQASKTERP